MRAMRVATVLTVLVVALGLVASTAFGQAASSAPAKSPQGGAAQSVPADVRAIFDNHCVKCHGGKTPAAGHDYSTDADLLKLVGMPSAEKSSIMMIDPGHPGNSYLIMKVTGATGILGARMPLAGTVLTAAQIKVLEDWNSGMPATPAASQQGSSGTKPASQAKDPKPSTTATATTAVGSSPMAAADEMFDGAYSYGLMCASCHGASGEGVTLFGPPLAGDAFVKVSTTDAIAYVINMGRKYRDKEYPEYSGMPKFHYVTGGELLALIDHLKGALQGM
jgi:mono/diheme cytochrome c family protein